MQRDARRHRQLGQRHAGQALLGDEEALVGEVAAVLAEPARIEAAQHGGGLADRLRPLGDDQQPVAQAAA